MSLFNTQFITGVKTSQTVDVFTSTNCLTVHCVTYTNTVHHRCEDESDSRRAHLDELSDRSLCHLHTPTCCQRNGFTDRGTGATTLWNPRPSLKYHLAPPTFGFLTGCNFFDFRTKFVSRLSRKCIKLLPKCTKFDFGSGAPPQT